MKKYIFGVLSAVVVSQLGFSAWAAPTTTYRTNDERSNLTKTQDFGLGIKWGSLTGISGKYWVNEFEAWDATVAFQNGNTAVGVDYLWHFRNAFSDATNSRKADSFVPYLGGGLISAFGSNTQFFNRNTDNFG